ncbi:MAG: hypothetical protein QGH40_17320 [bacterium]|jgi:hypothetical protein|nr:hypothetical protein [bacterium]
MSIKQVYLSRLKPCSGVIALALVFALSAMQVSPTIIAHALAGLRDGMDSREYCEMSSIGPGDHPDLTCKPGTDSHMECVVGEASNDRSCCPDECTYCSFACCGGTPPLVHKASQIFVSVPFAGSITAFQDNRPSPCDPTDIFRPPQV